MRLLGAASSKNALEAAVWPVLASESKECYGRPLPDVTFSDIVASCLQMMRVDRFGRSRPQSVNGGSRLRVVTYNCGGIFSELYDVICDWLSNSGEAGVVSFQEVRWGLGKQESTWRIPGSSFVVSADPSPNIGIVVWQWLLLLDPWQASTCQV